jgi:hypothetical protein
MRPSRAVVAVAAATTALALSLPATASASPVPSDPIATGFAGPLQIDVAHGNVWVGEAFAGLLTRVRPNGSTTVLTSQPGEIAGVAVRRYTVAFTTTSHDEANPGAALMVRRPDGTVRTVADLYAFESKHNPDARNKYGFLDLPPACAAQLPPEIPGATPYHGMVDSHPYAIANAPDGGWFVADAGGNTILKVNRRGHISVVSVLPPQRTKVTADAATAVGLPECTVGHTYAFEPVPTDVEVGRHGLMVASLLPGGPEDASLGARGSVVRIAPTGRAVPVAKGFLGATNVAIGRCGRIYVAEMFANRISVVRGGHVTPFVDVPSPASVEFSDGKLYASVDVFGAGSIVTIRP